MEKRKENLIKEYNPYLNIQLSERNYEDLFLEYFNSVKNEINKINKINFIIKTLKSNEKNQCELLTFYLLSCTTDFLKNEEIENQKLLMENIKRIKSTDDIIVLQDSAMQIYDYIKHIVKMDDVNKEYFNKLTISTKTNKNFFSEFNILIGKIPEKKYIYEDSQFMKKVIQTNDDKILEIINFYISNNQHTVATIEKLEKEINKIKDLILVSEPANYTKSHLKNIDKLVEQTKKYMVMHLQMNANNAEYENILFSSFKPNQEEYSKCIASFKEKMEKIITYYKKIYNCEEGIKKINRFLANCDKLIYKTAMDLGIFNLDNLRFKQMISKYQNISLNDILTFDNWIVSLRSEYLEFKKLIYDEYSNSIATKQIKKYDILFDNFLRNRKISTISSESREIKYVFLMHEKNVMNIIKKYPLMNNQEEVCYLKRDKYDEELRKFKNDIRIISDKIRQRYPKREAEKYINQILFRADLYTNNLCQKIGIAKPTNPWLIRNQLWKDSNDFISTRGIKYRTAINKPLKKLVGKFMDNEVIVEEECSLNDNQPYVFVSTHYFTEDIIGLLANSPIPIHVLFGTTNQIENNLLMLAANLFGFFYVDRLDSFSRKDCIKKQDILIDNNRSFANYVGGGWENSENELQPLSYSGPYRTSKEKKAMIVPVSSYLVREDKKIYMRFGTPIDMSKYDEEEGNEIIRDTLASMHYKQLDKYSYPVNFSPKIFDQHKNYMNEIANEYWNQYWTRPFAVEEICPRRGKYNNELEVYAFLKNISPEKLNYLYRNQPEVYNSFIEMFQEKDNANQYDIINYIDSNYEKFKEKNFPKKVKK